jgi:diacylglycerol kinase (ATP)
MRKIAIIANPSAGQGKAPSRARQLEAELGRSGLAPDCRVPESAGEARSIVEHSVSDGFHAVVIAGGDGSVKDVLDILAGTETALAILRSGRGNDFARGLGMPGRIRTLAPALVAGMTRSVDLGVCNGIPFGTVTTCGLDAEVGSVTSTGSRFGGATGYVLQALSCIHRFNGYSVRVEAEGKPIFDGEVTLVACANTPTYGGGLRIAPGADPSDGMLELCLIRRVTRLQAMSLLPLLAMGEHVGHPLVELRGVRNVHIFANKSVPKLVDGEPVSAEALKTTIRPLALKVIC